jgi:hypothetical protein
MELNGLHWANTNVTSSTFTMMIVASQVFTLIKSLLLIPGLRILDLEYYPGAKFALAAGCAGHAPVSQEHSPPHPPIGCPNREWLLISL